MKKIVICGFALIVCAVIGLSFKYRPISAYAADVPRLGYAPVATSGNYADLGNTPVIPTKISQLTNDAGFIGFAPFNVTFPATSLLAIGTYGPTSVAVPSAVMGQAVECNITNFQSTAYKAVGIVTAAGSAAVTLSVTTPLATNTTAPIARCFTY